MLNFRVSLHLSSIQNFFLYIYCFSLSIENINFYIATQHISVAKLSAFLYIISIIPHYRYFFTLSKEFVSPIILYFVWLIIISLININSYSSNFFEIEFFLNVIIFIVIINHARKCPLCLENSLLLFSLGAGLISISLFFGIGAEINSDGTRWTWLGAGHNELASKLSAAIVIIIASIIGRHSFAKRKHLMLILCIPFMLLAVLSTGSRSAALILMMAVLLWSFVKFMSDKKVLKNLVITLSVLITLLFFALESEIFVSRFQETLEDGDLPLGGRLLIWPQLISMIQSNIIFGYGLSGYEYQSYNVFGTIWSPHNVILELLLYTGVIGLALYGIFIFRLFRASYRLQKSIGKLLPILLISVILAFALTAQVLTEKVVWLFMSYIIGTYLNYKKQS